MTLMWRACSLLASTVSPARVAKGDKGGLAHESLVDKSFFHDHAYNSYNETIKIIDFIMVQHSRLLF